MLQPADLLLLDEPTNDVDIATLEVLEESLMEFPGALVLVTHDRYMLDRVSTTVLGLDGEGGWGLFADYSQWEQARGERERARAQKPAETSAATTPPPQRKKLSYIEAREYDGIEERIHEAEQRLAAQQSQMQDPEVARDAARLQQAYESMQAAQQEVDRLYERWAELEAKLA
jgi:ATP-binding cassette subfamily F protein uup